MNKKWRKVKTFGNLKTGRLKNSGFDLKRIGTWETTVDRKTRKGAIDQIAAWIIEMNSVGMRWGEKTNYRSIQSWTWKRETMNWRSK